VRDSGFRRRLYGKEIIGLERRVIVAKRPLRLVRLHGLGLTRLELKRHDLIDCGSNHYDFTAEWSQALYDCPQEPDGLIWASRQNDGSKAMILFGGRIHPTELEALADAVPLDAGPGLDEIRQACADSNIDFHP
jgi:hypothetical protein